MATPRFNHKPYRMVHRAKADEIKAIGEFTWEVDNAGKRKLIVAVPHLSPLGYLITEWTIGYRNESNAQWTWTGDSAAPTLHPSLHAVGVWHGKVTAGELVEAS